MDRFTTFVMVFACALATLGTHSEAFAGQEEAPQPQVVISGAQRQSQATNRWARTDGEVHGRLAFLRIHMRCDGCNPKDARRAFANALGLNLIDHFSAQANDALAPEELHLILNDIDASEALRLLVDASSGTRRGAWQVRNGILEIGPRDVLARRTAPVTRVYDITEMIIEPPYFASNGIQSAFTGGGPDTIRSNQREVGVKIMEAIINSVEPDSWIPPNEAEIADGIISPIDPRDPYRGRQLDPKLINRDTGALAPLKCEGKWASMYLKDKKLVVRAPMFVHIGIDGLPEAVPPPAILLQTPDTEG